MSVTTQIELLDSLLEPHRTALGNAYQAYKNHVTRMLNFCFYLADPNEEQRQKLIIAAAFHDIGIWTAGTLDYIDPSAETAIDYLRQVEKEDWIDEVVLMITEHHKLTAVKNSDFPMVEIFRKADLVDFSCGIFKCGIAKNIVNEVRAKIPNAGFHKTLLKLGLRQIKSKPFANPIPMMKW